MLVVIHHKLRCAADSPSTRGGKAHDQLLVVRTRRRPRLVDCSDDRVSTLHTPTPLVKHDVQNEWYPGRSRPASTARLAAARQTSAIDTPSTSIRRTALTTTGSRRGEKRTSEASRGLCHGVRPEACRVRIARAPDRAVGNACGESPQADHGPAQTSPSDSAVPREAEIRRSRTASG